MNIQEYISSGIVESCVLGLASNEERLEFEQLCAAHPELREAKEAFEISLEQHALANAVTPPADLKQKIWDDLGLQQNAGKLTSVPPAAGKMQPLTPVRSMGSAKFLAAASIVLLVASTVLNFYFYSQYKSSVTRLDEMVASNQEMAKNRDVMQTKLQQYEQSFEMLKDPAKTVVVAMKGQAVAPASQTTVYWDKQTKDVYLLVNNLPQPAANKQYQLWAMVDGVPVDAGVLDMTTSNGLVKMKNIPKAQAFAITLESTGGAKKPTMPIYVMGQI